MDSKNEVRSKPILSPTRSLDEGFESDPDRISTDSELATAQTTPAFDVLQRTDRDGVQHTQIARRTSPTTTQDTSSSSSKDSGPESIICLEGEIEKELRTKLEKTTLGRPPTGLPKAATAATGGHTQLRYRRIKTRAPPPPIGSYYYQKRSASVDSVNRAGGGLPAHGPASLYNLGLEPGSTANLHLDLASGPVSVGAPGSQPGHDVLAGRFVRVTVDPRHHQSQPPASLNQYRLASLSTNNIYKYCHAPAPMTGHYQHLHQQHQQQQQPLPHHPLHPLSHHHHHHPLHHHHHQTQQQHQQQQQHSMHHGHHLSYIPTSVAAGSGAVGGGSNRNNLYSLPPQYGLGAAGMGSGSHQSGAAAAAAAASAAATITASHAQHGATGSVALSGGPAAGSAVRNYQHFNHVPVCWTQSIPRQARSSLAGGTELLKLLNLCGARTPHNPNFVSNQLSEPDRREDKPLTYSI
uniref:Uncharacterized protein n=1 Tax=Anopheles epiroticus TaxID=199890 RepID=A0A182P009_9DIPT